MERIEWREIDLAVGFVHLGSDKAKTRSRRLVPVLPNLAAWLAPYAKHGGKVWRGTSNELQHARADLVKASGVAWKDDARPKSFSIRFETDGRQAIADAWTRGAFGASLPGIAPLELGDGS